MRISDWSSDVCSSDLTNSPFGKNALAFCSRHRAALCFSLSSELGSAEREITPTIPAAIGNPPTNVRRSIWRPPSYAQIVHKRSEEHTSELQSLMRISYAVFCLKKKKKIHQTEYILHKSTL